MLVVIVSLLLNRYLQKISNDAVRLLLSSIKELLNFNNRWTPSNLCVYS